MTTKPFVLGPALALLTFLYPYAARAQIEPGALLGTDIFGGTVVSFSPGTSTVVATGLSQPVGVCQGPNGDIFVAEHTTGQITVINAGGDLSAAEPYAFGLPTAGPGGLHCTKDGIFVATWSGGRVYKITAGGDYTGATPFATIGPSVSGIFVSGAGKVYAGTLSSVIDVSAGGNQSAAAAFASGAAAYQMLEFQGKFLATDYDGAKIYDITAGGAATTVFASMPRQYVSFATSGSKLYAASFEGSGVDIYDVTSGGVVSGDPWATAPNVQHMLGLYHLSKCGDGFVEHFESCDDGGESALCDTDCTSSACGDGKPNLTAGEMCDNGAANSDTLADACRTTCKPAGCGDAVVDAGEECDDGSDNSDTNADACRTSCKLAKCGDGVVDSDESCDDDNTKNGDGCSSTCVSETTGEGGGAGAPGEAGAAGEAGESEPGESQGGSSSGSGGGNSGGKASAGSAATDAGSPGEGDGAEPSTDSGCSCRVAGGTGPSAGFGAGGLLFVAALIRLRRRLTAPRRAPTAAAGRLRPPRA